MTGPQSVLPAFQDDQDHQDDPYGERTGAWIRGVQQDHANIAAELVAEQGGKAPAPGHARRRGARSWFRRYRPGPVASGTAAGRLHATAPADEPTVGHVALEHLQHGAAHDGPPADYSESWGPWDEPGVGDELVPAYVPDIAADLADLLVFRQAIGRRTRCHAGATADGRTWGEQMVLEGTRLLAPPEIAAFTFGTAPRELIAAEQAERDGTTIGWGGVQVRTPDGICDALNRADEAYDALHPVPAAPEQAGAEDVTA